MQTSQEAAAWLTHSSAVLVDWVWSRTCSTLILVRSNNGHLTLVWHSGGACVQCPAPQGSHSVDCSPDGQHFKLQSGQGVAVHCTHSGSRLLHLGKETMTDSDEHSEACLCVLLTHSSWPLRPPS